MKQSIDISVVVPVFNSSEILEELYKRLVDVLIETNLSFEILFIEDGESKNTWEKLLEIKQKDQERVSIFQLAKNCGQNATTLCGVNFAKGNLIVTIDDDLQTPPEDIKPLINKLKTEKLTVVYGIPKVQKQGFIRKLGSTLIKKIFFWIEGSTIGSSFRIFTNDMKDKLSQSFNDHLFINQIITWYTNDIGYVQVDHHPRNHGKSGYRFFDLVGISFRLLFYYTDFPLRFMIGLGLLTSLICFCVGSFYIYEKIQFGATLGFTSIITAIFFATGIIITCISILGVYINRIYNTRIKKPIYSIKAFIE